MEETLDLQPLSQFHVCADTEILNMFTVAEHLNLDNIDFSCLQDLCVDEKGNPDAIPMANCNSMMDTVATQSQALTSDWLSGNLNLDLDFLSDINFSQSQISNQDSFAINSVDASLPSISDTANILVDVPELESPVSFLTERPSSEEKFCISSYEPKTIQRIECNVQSTVLESEEVSSHHSDETGSCIAGKKYYQMRKKNNLASQRSRKLRKQKNQEMSEKLKILEHENKTLLLQAEELERQRDILKNQLQQILSRK